MSVQRFSSTSGAAKRRVKKRNGGEVAKFAGSIYAQIHCRKQP